MSKELKIRIQNKIDTETNWDSNTDFIPLRGEAIIYEICAADGTNLPPRIKFGDGKTPIGALPFASNPIGTSSSNPSNQYITENPTCVSELVYTGASQQPTWSYNTEQMQISQLNSGVNAGSYTTYFTPINGYCWPDNSFVDKGFTWTINQAEPTLSINPKSIKLNPTVNYAEITVNTESGGAVSAQSADETAVVIDSVSKNTVKVRYTGSGSGSTNIIITVAESTNYLKKSEEVSITYDLGLRGLTWENIAKEVQNGNASKLSELFTVGDIMPVTLNGEIYCNRDYHDSCTKFDENQELYVRLIHIDDDNKQLYFQCFVQELEGTKYDICLNHKTGDGFSTLEGDLTYYTESMSAVAQCFVDQTIVNYMMPVPQTGLEITHNSVSSETDETGNVTSDGYSCYTGSELNITTKLFIPTHDQIESYQYFGLSTDHKIKMCYNTTPPTASNWLTYVEYELNPNAGDHEDNVSWFEHGYNELGVWGTKDGHGGIAPVFIIDGNVYEE